MKEFPNLGTKHSYDYLDVEISHVRAHLDEAGIPHKDSNIPNRYNISACFAEEPSTEGDLLLDFVSHSIGFRQHSDEILRTKFMRFLDSDKCTEKANGTIFFKSDWGLVTVFKNK